MPLQPQPVVRMVQQMKHKHVFQQVRLLVPILLPQHLLLLHRFAMQLPPLRVEVPVAQKLRRVNQMARGHQVRIRMRRVQ